MKDFSKKKAERKQSLFEISNNLKTTILYESPHRLIKLLKELKEYCGGTRKIHISRELTKRFEQNINLDIDNAIKFFEGRKVIGEITIVLKGKDKLKNREFDKNYLKRELKELIEAGLSLSAASSYLAKKTELNKSTIYNLY